MVFLTRLILLTGIFAFLCMSPAFTVANSLSAQVCDCYAVSNSLFTTHTLYNFSTTPSVGVSVGPGATEKRSALSTAFTSILAPQSYTTPASSTKPLTKSFSPANVYLTSDSSGSDETYLRLTTTRSGSTQSTAELASPDTSILYGSFRITARVTGAAGAVASIFTYTDDSHEVDWEVLTKEGTRSFHATNQPGSDVGATRNVSLPDGPGGRGDLGEWNEWRLDWTSGVTEMYFNGVMVDEKVVNVPAVPGAVLVNMWSDGGSWSGVMADGGEAFLDVKAVEMYYNSTSSSAGKGGGCRVICPAAGTGTGSSTGAGAANTTATPDAATSTASTAAPTSSSISASTSALSSSSPSTTPPASNSNLGSLSACGPSNSSAVCGTGLCCSHANYCGTGPDYCGGGCQDKYGVCYDHDGDGNGKRDGVEVGFGQANGNWNGNGNRKRDVKKKRDWEWIPSTAVPGQNGYWEWVDGGTGVFSGGAGGKGRGGKGMRGVLGVAVVAVVVVMV